MSIVFTFHFCCYLLYVCPSVDIFKVMFDAIYLLLDSVYVFVHIDLLAS